VTSIDKIRNVAIIAHIDHGKTTLIDSIFREAHTFRENAHVEERVMDNNEIERERGITIRAKHCTVMWNGHLINIIDTPGHADFSGEVERTLGMVDSVLLLVDANEGPMPQTRYVLMRSLRLGLCPIVVVNKVDRPNARPDSALDKTFDLFVELGATDAQLDFPVLYGSGLNGWIVRDLKTEAHEGMDPLFETIVERVPAPTGDPEAPFCMQISTIGWNDHIGRTGTGRVLQGRLKKGQQVKRIVTQWSHPEKHDGHIPVVSDNWHVTETTTEKATYFWSTVGLDHLEVEEALAGDIVTIAGPKDLFIGDTIAAPELENAAMPPLEIEEPTVTMLFMVNTGPFAGKDGKAVTIRQIKARLERELRTNVALRMKDAERADAVQVSGRGELHLAILIEEMRREGMELCVSPPEIITRRNELGKLMEPFEELTIDVPIDYQGTVMDKVARRKGELMHMHNEGHGLMRIEFKIPTRGLIGYRSEFLTDTRGLGIIASRFMGYEPWCGEIQARNRGSMISMDTGEAASYSMLNLQERGTLFISPMQPVYMGMIVGECARPGDLPCNPTKKKALTNHRAANKDQTVVLDVPRILTLDAALEWIAPDELVEVTPQTIRLRKAILDAEERKRAEKRNNATSLAG
jgi:GTP-binding protein